MRLPWFRKRYTAAVEYEIYANDRPVRWGNLMVTYDRYSLETLLADIRAGAAESTGLPPDDVRIVGFWRVR